MLQTWFKIFYRNSKKNWLNIFINVSGFTLGFSGLLMVLLYLNNEKSYNQWNPYKNEIYRVVHQDDGGVMEVSTGLEGEIYKNRNPEVLDYMLVMGRYDKDVARYENTPYFLNKIVVSDKKFFDFFPFEFATGTPKTFSENINNTAISMATANQIFGTTNVLGKVIHLDGMILTVTGVYKLEPYSYFMPDIVIQFPERMQMSSWGNFNYELFCKFSKNPNIASAEKIMNDAYVEFRDKPAADERGLSLENFHDKYGKMNNKLEKLSTIRLHHLAKKSGPEGAGNYQLLMVLLSLSILLIIISSVNVINLSTASASQRAKEVGVKKTIGFSKKLLIGQYVLEIIFQALISILFAFILVELLLPHFNEFIGKSLSIFDGSTLLVVVVVALIISLFIGIIPAIYLSNFKAIEVLKGNFSRSKKGILMRNAMLGLQFLISGFFLIGVLVIYAQIDFMMTKDTGFKSDQIVVVNLTERDDKFKKYELAKQILPQHPNIIGVSSSLFVPGKSYVNGTSMSYKDLTTGVATNFTDFNYIDFAEVKIIKGRNLDEKFASDSIKSILINETAAKEFGIYDNPINKKMDLHWGEEGKDLNIVGVFKNIHIGGFDEEIYPMMIANWKMFDRPKKWIRDIQIKIKPENISETMSYIENYWKENVEQGYPFSYEFLDKQYAKTYEKYQKQQTMFLILSFIVILIALLGLFALATLTIQQRLKEVAIRKTLGASAKEIVIQLVIGFLKLSIIASILLIPIAYYFMQNWLDNFVYRINMPIWPYIITPIILLILVYTVVGLKAYNATKIDLIKYLKFE